MKNIFVVLPVQEKHKQQLEAAAGDKAKITYLSNPPGGNRVDAPFISDADFENVQGLIGNVTPEFVKNAKDLEFIQFNSAGIDPYMKPGILNENIKYYSAVGAYGRSVSEWMVGMTFALLRKFPKYMRNQVEHFWNEEGNVTSVEDSTVLVLGLGDIGGSYAKKVKALGAHVIGVRATNKPKPDYVDEQYTFDKLPEVIGRADIIATVLPSTPETKNIFNDELFAKCKPGSYLINGGRGDAVDQNALMRALDSGILAGAGLDVTVPEPLPEDHPLWDYKNVFITPHIAGKFYLAHTFDRIIELACEHMQDWLASE